MLKLLLRAVKAAVAVLRDYWVKLLRPKRQTVSRVSWC